MKTRFISVLVVLTLALGLFPITAFAADDWYTDDELDALLSDLKNYDEQRQYAVENCLQPELKQWILDNLGRKIGGCQQTPNNFGADVFGVSMALSSTESRYWSDWKTGDTYREYWTFIWPYEGMRYEPGDVAIKFASQSASSWGASEGHFSMIVGETASYYINQWGTNYDNFVVVQSSKGFEYVTLSETSYAGGVPDAILRPDFSQTLANRGVIITPDTPNIDTASTWAHDGINAAVSKGFVPSDIQDNYTNTITRAEFCRMAVKWLEYKTGKSINAILADKGLNRDPNAFTDTKDPDILAAYALGITSGIGNNKFNPTGQFSREQASTMIRNTCKAANMDISNTTSAEFEDIGTASSWAVDGINFCYQNKIMTGTSTKPLQFSPKATYTREQSIITFNNIK